MYGIWTILIMIIISALPVIAVIIWFRYARYQFSLLWFLLALLIGAAAVFPALIFQELLSSFRPLGGRAELFYEFFFRSAFVEESCRLMLLFFFFLTAGLIKPKNDKELPSWGMIKKKTAAGFIAGLGFAILENAIYTVSSMNVNLLLLRSITAAPLHAACGSRVGCAAAIIRTNPFQAVLRLLTATAIHGIYNLMIRLPGLPAVMAILIAITALITAILSIKGSWEEQIDSPQPT